MRALTPEKSVQQHASGGTSVAAAVSRNTPSPSAPTHDAPPGCTVFYFCEKCGKRVTNADLAAGRGRDKQLKGVYCAGCSDGAGTVGFDAASRPKFTKEDRKRHPSERRATSTRLQRPKAPSKTDPQHSLQHPSPRRSAGPKIAIAAAVAVIALVAVLGLFVFSSGNADPKPTAEVEPPTRTPTTEPDPATPKPKPTPPINPAAKQLADIQSKVTTDLSAYAQISKMLDQFLKTHAGTPEAERAKALRSEVNSNYAKLADTALSKALTAAKASAANERFDEAETTLRSVEKRFGKGPWFESKAKEALATALTENAKRRAALVQRAFVDALEQAREKFQAGQINMAKTLIADRTEWPAEVRTQADQLFAQIEEKAAEAAAAKKLAEERNAILAEFDRFMIATEHAEARDYAKSKVTAEGTLAQILRAGKQLAEKLTSEPAAIVRGAKTLIGREVRLKLNKGHIKAIIKTVTDAGLGIATTYKINNKVKERSEEVKWHELHREQKADFARRGGFEISASEKAILSAYAALASNDLAAAGQALNGASHGPLGVHLSEVVQAKQRQRAYESAMKEAEKLIAGKKLNDAVKACEDALAIKPDDATAVALLAEVQERRKAPQTLTLDIGDGLKLEFVYIRPGTFTMGGESTSEGRFSAVEVPKHEVTITKGFYLGKYEVTQAQFQAIMGKNPSRSTKDPNCPVDSAHWHEELEFCKRAAEKTGQKVRLPTEAEWEFACRAGTGADWGHGSDPGQLGEYAWISSNSGHKSHPVGQKKPNPWGLYDMHGNVCERVGDFYHRDYYANSPKEDPTGPEGRFDRGDNGTTLLRGGTWKSSPDGCRAGTRLRGGGYGHYNNWGFRVAVTVDDKDY